MKKIVLTALGNVLTVAFVFAAMLHDIKYTCITVCPNGVPIEPRLLGVEISFLLLSLCLILILSSWGFLYLKSYRIALISSMLPIAVCLLYISLT